MMVSRIRPLSARAVESLTNTASVGGAPGLQLVVSHGGTRSWRLFYRLPSDAKRRAIKPGPYPAITLARARDRANELLEQAAAGIDPKSAQCETVAKRQVSFADAIERYLDWCGSQNGPKTVQDKRSLLVKYAVGHFGQTPLVDVTRKRVLELLDSLADRPPTRRNLHIYLHHFFGWAVDRELAPGDPMAGLKPPKGGKPRERVLSDEEIAALWAVDGVMASIARLSLLTAQRRGSLEAMRWQAIDFGERIWSVPPDDMKSGRSHRAPLSDLAIAELERIPRMTGPHVFGVGSDGAKPYKGGSNGMEGLRKKLGNPDWRLHDLRRTAVTLAQRGCCMIEEIRALTQHKTPGVIGVYARHGYEDEKRKVVGVIEEVVRAIVEPAAHGRPCGADRAF